MRKRLYALALCLLLIVSPLSVFADEEPAAPVPELTISSEREESTLTVTVGIKNNNGISGVDISLHFNSSALKPSSEPCMGDGTWTYKVTNFENFSGDTLRVAAVSNESFTGNGEIFTASFEVLNEDSYALFADGTACSYSSDSLVKLVPGYADDFGIKSLSRTGNGVTAVVVSYGDAYHGSARAFLSCYKDGKYLGCTVMDLDIGQNSANEIVFDRIPFAGNEFKMLLIGSDFQPLCKAFSL